MKEFLFAPRTPEQLDCSGFARISELVTDCVIDMRYHSDYNFTGKRVDGYLAPVPMLTIPAAKALARAAEILRGKRFRILIYDAYRPLKALECFMRWLDDPSDPGDHSFYPRIAKSAIREGRYIDPKSAHTRGSAVDLTLVTREGMSVDMGGTFDLFDDISHNGAPGLTQEQQANRKMLSDAMVSCGFGTIQSEWWHFKLKDEPYPETFFDFDVK